MSFANGDKRSELVEIGTTKKRDTGTTVRFWPNEKYFDTAKLSSKQLNHVLRAKAVLCPGLSMTFINKITQEETFWCYEHGLVDYLRQSLPNDAFPDEPFAGEFKSDEATVDWALAWSTTTNSALNESYVKFNSYNSRWNSC